MMKIRLVIWKTDKSASDSSVISRDVWEKYIKSEACQEALRDGSMLSSLTHRSRTLKALPEGTGALSGVTAKDDSLLLTMENCPAPVTKITKLYLDGNDVMAEAEVFDENQADPAMSNNIKRLKTLLRSGVKLGCSCVLVCYWEPLPGTRGSEYAKAIVALKGVDFTIGPSMKGAKVVGIIEDDQETTFSEKDLKIMESGGVSCKVFSDTDVIPGYKNLPKTSKIGLRVCNLKAKQFSQITDFTISEDSTEEPKEKNFSVATVKERVRYSKLSPRVQFRRLVLDYRQALKASGGPDKIKPEELQTMRTLFANDILYIMKQIHGEIMKGKQINVLIGASTISKNCRAAAASLQLPYRMAMMQQQKAGYISKDRMKKIQDAYVVFVDSIMNEIFGENKLKIDDEAPDKGEEQGEEGNEKN